MLLFMPEVVHNARDFQGTYVDKSRPKELISHYNLKMCALLMSIVILGKIYNNVEPDYGAL